jgi:hypothetical protein
VKAAREHPTRLGERRLKIKLFVDSERQHAHQKRLPRTPLERHAVDPPHHAPYLNDGGEIEKGRGPSREGRIADAGRSGPDPSVFGNYGVYVHANPGTAQHSGSSQMAPGAPTSEPRQPIACSAIACNSVKLMLMAYHKLIS